MQLQFDTELASAYTSNSQKIRIITEDWVKYSVFCPSCGSKNVTPHPNNKPVADFFCSSCNEEYELKSKKGAIGNKIVDGAYASMIDRLNSSSNPNFFILSYDKSAHTVKDFLVVPKHFFSSNSIEKRNPLSATAKRAGWVGCNLLLGNIPESGKVYYVRNGVVLPKNDVLSKWTKTVFLREEKELAVKGWLIDIIRIVENIASPEFRLEDVYKFENELALLHPENKHIKEKIRQQLQVLRDKNYLKFIARGKYLLI